VAGDYWTYGGFGDYVRSLLPHFDKVILACHPRVAESPPPGWYKLEAPNLSFEWLPFYTREDQCLRKLPGMFWQCRKIASKADVINGRVPDYTGICGAFWAKLQNKPLFLNIVDDWHNYSRDLPTRLNGLLRLGLKAHLKVYCAFERMFCRNTLVFAQGKSVFERYRNNPQTHFCVSSSHSIADIVGSRDVSMAKPTFHIVTIGRLVNVKGHRNLIEAVAGEGPNSSAYSSLALALGIEEILQLPGQVGRKEVFELLDTADAFCLPSLSEGTPKVLLEAMARGIPVVATRVGGVESVVEDGATGLLIEPNDPHLIADALHRLATDAALRQRLCNNGLSRAHKHTIEKEWTSMVETVRATFPRAWNNAGASS
jgi:glycosyltransferase involved in cell wall biosynthesis